MTKDTGHNGTAKSRMTEHRIAKQRITEHKIAKLRVAKRIITCFAVLAAVLCFGAASAELEAESFDGVVNTEALNVRTGAGTNYEVLKSGTQNVILVKDTKVKVVEEPTSGWYKVEFTYNGTPMTGYVASRYITNPDAAATTAATTASSVAVPSTPMEFVNKLTMHSVTPSTADTAFSTRALQAAQLIPETKYCFMEPPYSVTYFSAASSATNVKSLCS